MIDLKEFLYQKVTKVMDQWNDKNIYAISFFVYSNEAYEYNGINNVSEFNISYNTEEDCNHAGKFSEERWNYAFWSCSVSADILNDEEMAILFDWYNQEEITDIGYESPCYDEKDKGPNGYYELLMVISEVARQLQEENYLENKFGYKIPILVHDLEYPWYIVEATKNANPNGEADNFLYALKNDYMINN